MSTATVSKDLPETDRSRALLTDEGVGAEKPETTAAKHSLRFWAIIASLSFTALCSSIEGTIITSALPSIAEALGGASTYIWVPNGYFLATIATLPLMAQASDLFGRRWLIIGSVALFTLGSGLCGGAYSMNMLIGSRVVQGLGGGGIQLMINVILTDLVPLRERGKYMAIVQMTNTIGAALGPFLGGLITSRSTWRWVFWINLPIGGVSLILLSLSLRLRYERNLSLAERLSRIDFAGNAIFIASVVSILLAITWGGSVYAWNQHQVIVPLVLGFMGVVLFLTYEWTLAKYPSFPRTVFSNRTSVTVLVVTFIHTVVTYWAFYFLPIYFQSIQVQSPLQSGVSTLPLFVGLFPFAILGGATLSKFGRYKAVHLFGFAVLTVSFGLFSLLSPYSSTAAWACFQLLCAVGSGILIATFLPAMQAPLDEGLVAASTGVWTFVRGFGTIWGVTIPGAIFNNECRIHAAELDDKSLAAYLSGGRAYQYATQAFIETIVNPNSRNQVVQVFYKSMRTVWYVGTALAGLGSLLTLIEKEVVLRTKLNTKYGLDEESKQAADNNAEAGRAVELPRSGVNDTET